MPCFCLQWEHNSPWPMSDWLLCIIAPLLMDTFSCYSHICATNDRMSCGEGKSVITQIFLPRKTRRALQHWLNTFKLIVALIQLAATPTATSRWQTERNLLRKLWLQVICWFKLFVETKMKWINIEDSKESALQDCWYKHILYICHWEVNTDES